MRSMRRKSLKAPTLQKAPTLLKAPTSLNPGASDEAAMPENAKAWPDGGRRPARVCRP